MFDRDDYILQISKLKRGENIVEADIDRRLFESFDCSDAEDITGRVRINAIKSERMLEIHFNIVGQIKVLCSRCLSEMNINVKKSKILYVKFGDKFEQVDMDEWVVRQEDNEVDLLPYVYEEFRIEIPIAPVHKNIIDCDKEMIEKLSLYEKVESRDKNKEIDPRWEKLKELKTIKN